MLWGITIRFQKLSLSQRQVAHVLLTRPPLRIKTNPYSPFDLHVLSVPPAFVLSQDQTLYKSCISISVSTELRSLFNNACVITAHFYTLCLSFPFFKGISRVVTFLHCSIFKMLFRVSLSCGTLLLYHIQKILSSTFFKFFQNFLFVIFAVLCRPAFLLYHIQFSLSSTFSSFLKNFSVWPPVLSDQLFYYITFNSICQVLFSSFSKFSFKWLVTRLTVQLLYYITYRSFCQVLFQKNQKLLQT